MVSPKQSGCSLSVEYCSGSVSVSQIRYFNLILFIMAFDLYFNIGFLRFFFIWFITSCLNRTRNVMYEAKKNLLHSFSESFELFIDLFFWVLSTSMNFFFFLFWVLEF